MAYTSKCEMTIYLKLRIYRKIPKISRRAYIFQRPFMRGLSAEGNLRFKIDRASHIVGRKFTIFALFCIMTLGAYIWSSLYMEGLIFGILRHVTQPPPPAKRASSKVYIYISPSCLGWSCFKLTVALMTPAFALNPSFVTT